MQDLSEIHQEKPKDTDLKLLFIPSVGKHVIRETGFYEIQWDKWYLSDECTEVHPLGWSYLNEWPEQ